MTEHPFRPLTCPNPRKLAEELREIATKARDEREGLATTHLDAVYKIAIDCARKGATGGAFRTGKMHVRTCLGVADIDHMAMHRVLELLAERLAGDGFRTELDGWPYEYIDVFWDQEKTK